MEQSQSTQPDSSQCSDLDEFVQSLQRLRIWAGNPSLRTLAKKAGPLLRPPRVLSHTTLAHLFQPDRRRLDLDLVLAVVRALGLDEIEVHVWRTAWFRVHAGAKSAGSARALRQLPADLATFTGRERELQAIVGAIGAASDRGSTVVISAIDGMAGVGKSALAVRAAHLLSDRFPDGQLFVDLHGFTRGMAPRDPADALASVLASLGVPPGRIPAQPDARAAAYRDRLAGTRTLVLLDNAASEAQVRPLIPGDAGCLVLVTSRRRLKALDEARTVTLDVLPVPDAVALLRALVEPGRVPADDPGWELIAELCGCLPLALRIAAALIRHRPAWTLGHLADKLRAAPLDLGPFTDGERDLTAVFDLSYQTLSSDQQGLLRRLGLAPGPDIDAHAAAALLDSDPADAERLLQGLVDHHLLSEPAADRYRMHDLIRAYAHARSATLDPEPERALGRLLRYYAETAQSATRVISLFPQPEPSGPVPVHVPDLRDPDVARDWLRTEQANLDAAFTYAHTHHLDGHTVALAAGLADILHTDGPWMRALDVHRTAAETAERLGQPAAHATALTDLGRARHQTGDYLVAGDVFVRALEIYREIGDRLGQATALTDLGRVRHQTGDYPAADDALAQALEIYRAIGHRDGEATALNALGRVRQLTGDYPGADDALTRALETYRAIGHRGGEAYALTDLGRVRQLTGDHPGADDALSRALQIYREIGERSNEAWVLNHYAAAIATAGDRRRALALYQQALTMNQELNKPDDEAISLEGIADHHLTAGDTSQGTAHLLQALELYQQLGMNADVERVHIRLRGLA